MSGARLVKQRRQNAARSESVGLHVEVFVLAGSERPVSKCLSKYVCHPCGVYYSVVKTIPTTTVRLNVWRTSGQTAPPEVSQ
ncbi:hypothetical protein J6590_096778 [Homalodisca vitripennis]|nr:hypothetical protein J6590_096778 [Homalodisca vitripennis]